MIQEEEEEEEEGDRLSIKYGIKVEHHDAMKVILFASEPQKTEGSLLHLTGPLLFNLIKTIMN